MLHRSEFNRKTGVYRSCDCIENLKLRVILQKIDHFLNVVHVATVSSSNETPSEPDKSVINIDWQQKHFSAKELVRYANIETCQTDLHKRYHQQSILQKDQNPNPTIYTYIAEDCFVPDPNCIASNPEHFFGLNDSSTGNSPNNDVSMLVMATLLDNVETVLFTITWKPDDHMLLVYPDFNNIETNPYLKEIDSDRRQFYQYAIENVSNTDASSDEEYNMDQLNKAFSMANVHPKVSNALLLFAIPPRRCCFVTILLEIVSAQDFEYDNVHVRYRIRLPDRCELTKSATTTTTTETDKEDQQQLLVASTHSSVKSQTDGVCWLGHTLELSLLCHDDYRIEDYLRISYEVISIDNWQRERNEGYASQTVPLLPGYVESKLRCYRNMAEENSLLGRLERYYLGGRSAIFSMEEFHDATPSAINCSSTVQRFGNLTKSTGLLNITTRIILQHSQLEIDHQQQQRRSKQSFGDMYCSQNFPISNINEVIDAYTKAKRRLEAAAAK